MTIIYFYAALAAIGLRTLPGLCYKEFLSTDKNFHLFMIKYLRSTNIKCH